ncbi:hypothetical protein NEDG_00403 [Nematocida displodere]|uniref:SWIM-type domain-containing protein n=1 Tax=Nematocida displodere TaxID=1805483 RepID=A0A177EJ82_9MICR|nr:hypothetical protein NEDG_00403 [Nematocida displodere]
MQLSVGDVFKSKNEAQNAIRMYSVDNNFGFETTDSTPKKYTIQCKERRTHGCDAIITTALRKKDNMFVIKKLKNTHNCPQQSSCLVQSSSRYIADELRDMEDIRDTRIGQLINRISARRGIKIGYFAAWKAREDVLENSVDEETAQEECLKTAMYENRALNPDDVTICCNMKEKIEEWKEAGYVLPEERGFIRKIIRTIGPFDIAGSRADTLFYLSHLSQHVYKHSRKVIELSCHERYNEFREHAGYAYMAMCYDAFDSPYILAMAYTPEYCPRKEGWVFFAKELLQCIDQGVLMMDWEGDHSLIGELEKEVQKKNGKITFEENNPWAGHFDIAESIRSRDLESFDAEKTKACLFIRTRSLCREIFSTHSCPNAISQVWSLCNSPDLATFQVYYKKVKALNVPSLLSLLSSLPTHLWAKYLTPYPLYNKNNSIVTEIETVHAMLTLSPVDSMCMILKIVSDNALKKKELISHSELTTKKNTDRARFGDSINRSMERNIAKGQSYEVDVGRTPEGLSRTSWIDPRRLNDEEEHGQGIVYSGNLRFYVDLRLRVCSCMKFQEMNYPCSHACALITKIGSHPYAYIDEIYSVDTLTHMYKPLSNRCIVNEPIRGTEEKRRGPGRPRKGIMGYETEEFSCQEHKENMARH